MNSPLNSATNQSSLSQTPQTKVLIIPLAEMNDAQSYLRNAESLFRELHTLQDGFSNAQQLLQDGDSCTAVDILLKITKDEPRSIRAKSIFDDATKLQNESMILCADKIAEKGSYQRARTMLQPYASQNEPFQKALGKIADRQNREMTEKARQKKEIMEDIKKDDRRWGAIGIGASILGGLLLLAGVIGAFLGQVSAAVVSSLSAILPGLVVALYYNRSDKIRSDRLKLIEKSAGEEQLDLDVVRQATGLGAAKNGSQSAGEKE
jgi:hypothetical protein